MPERVAVVDTGVLLCWLEVPGKETAGSHGDFWNNARANAEIEKVIKGGGTIVLPNAVAIEVGRLISQAPNARRSKAEQLLDRVLASLEPRAPWRRFHESERLWTRDWYTAARMTWPGYADRRISLTDYSLLAVVRYFREAGIDANLLTTENELRSEAEAIPVKAHTRQRRRR